MDQSQLEWISDAIRNIVDERLGDGACAIPRRNLKKASLRMRRFTRLIVRDIFF